MSSPLLTPQSIGGTTYWQRRGIVITHLGLPLAILCQTQAQVTNASWRGVSVWRHSEKPSIFLTLFFFLGGGGRHRKGGIDGGRPARVRKSYGCVMWRMAGR